MGQRLNWQAEGHGEPLLLLHPVGLDLSCWDPVVKELGEDFRILRMDLRGHGGSIGLPPARSVEDYAADVAETLSAIGAAPVAVVGVSFGGMVATALAIHHVRLVSSLVVSACPSAIPSDARQALRKRGEMACGGGMEAVVEETLDRWFTPDFVRSPAVEPYRHRLLSDDPQAWSDAWSAISRLDLTDRLQQIRAPALCIHAENDKATPLAAMRETASLIPQCELSVIPGAPHMVHVQCPAPFAEEVRRFLASRLRQVL